MYFVMLFYMLAIYVCYVTHGALYLKLYHKNLKGVPLRYGHVTHLKMNFFLNLFFLVVDECTV